MSYLRNHPRKTFTYQINGTNVKIEPFNIEKYPKYLANVKVSLTIGTNKYYVKNVNEFNELRENDIGRINKLWSNYHGWCDFDASFKNVYYKDWRIWYKWQMRPSYSCKYSWQRPWSCQHYDSVLAANNIYKHKIYNQFVRDQIKYHYHEVNKRATKLQAESEKKRKQIAEKKKQIAEKKKRKQIAELQQQSIKNYFQPEMVQGNDNKVSNGIGERKSGYEIDIQVVLLLSDVGKRVINIAQFHKAFEINNYLYFLREFRLNNIDLKIMNKWNTIYNDFDGYVGIYVPLYECLDYKYIEHKYSFYHDNPILYYICQLSFEILMKIEDNKLNKNAIWKNCNGYPKKYKLSPLLIEFIPSFDVVQNILLKYIGYDCFYYVVIDGTIELNSKDESKYYYNDNVRFDVNDLTTSYTKYECKYINKFGKEKVISNARIVSKVFSS